MANNRGRLSADNWSTASVHDMTLFNDAFSTSPVPHTTNNIQGMGENTGDLGLTEIDDLPESPMCPPHQS